MMAQSNSACFLANPTTTSGDHFSFNILSSAQSMKAFGASATVQSLIFIEGLSCISIINRIVGVIHFSILELNPKGIRAVVEQQFEVARQILDAGLVPIIEPEVDIYSEKKDEVETILKEELLRNLDTLHEDDHVILKLTIPTVANTYKETIDHLNVLRVVALSGGYSRDEANVKLKENDGLIASFSRALSQDLNVNQTDEEFNAALKDAIDSIFDASVNKKA